MSRQLNYFYGLGFDRFDEGFRPLKGCVADSLALKETFSNIGWEAQCNNGTNKGTIEENLKKLSENFNSKNVSDFNLLIYIASHGFIINGEGYLAVSGSKRNDTKSMISTGELKDWILCLTEELQKKNDSLEIKIGFIFDACRKEIIRSDDINEDAEETYSAYRHYANQIDSAVKDTKLHLFYIYSCQEGGVSKEDRFGPDFQYRGLFSRIMEKEIKTGKNKNLYELVNRVNKQLETNDDSQVIETKGAFPKASNISLEKAPKKRTSLLILSASFLLLLIVLISLFFKESKSNTAEEAANATHKIFTDKKESLSDNASANLESDPLENLSIEQKESVKSALKRISLLQVAIEKDDKKKVSLHLSQLSASSIEKVVTVPPVDKAWYKLKRSLSVYAPQASMEDLLWMLPIICVSELDQKKFTDLKTQALDGDAVAMYQLGVAYDNGVAVERDSKEALSWLRKSVNAGCLKGAGLLAFILTEDCYDNEVWEEAVTLMERAWKSGELDAWSRTNLLKIYLQHPHFYNPELALSLAIKEEPLLITTALKTWVEPGKKTDLITNDSGAFWTFHNRNQYFQKTQKWPYKSKMFSTQLNWPVNILNRQINSLEQAKIVTKPYAFQLEAIKFYSLTLKTKAINYFKIALQSDVSVSLRINDLINRTLMSYEYVSDTDESQEAVIQNILSTKKNVSEELFKFKLASAAMMCLLNEIYKQKAKTGKKMKIKNYALTNSEFHYGGFSHYKFSFENFSLVYKAFQIISLDSSLKKFWAFMKKYNFGKINPYSYQGYKWIIGVTKEKGYLDNPSDADKILQYAAKLSIISDYQLEYIWKNLLDYDEGNQKFKLNLRPVFFNLYWDKIHHDLSKSKKTILEYSPFDNFLREQRNALLNEEIDENWFIIFSIDKLKNGPLTPRETLRLTRNSHKIIENGTSKEQLLIKLNWLRYLVNGWVESNDPGTANILLKELLDSEIKEKLLPFEQAIRLRISIQLNDQKLINKYLHEILNRASQKKVLPHEFFEYFSTILNMDGLPFFPDESNFFEEDK